MIDIKQNKKLVNFETLIIEESTKEAVWVPNSYKNEKKLLHMYLISNSNMYALCTVLQYVTADYYF